VFFLHYIKTHANFDRTTCEQQKRTLSKLLRRRLAFAALVALALSVEVTGMTDDRREPRFLKWTVELLVGVTVLSAEDTELLLFLTILLFPTLEVLTAPLQRLNELIISYHINKSLLKTLLNVNRASPTNAIDNYYTKKFTNKTTPSCLQNVTSRDSAWFYIYFYCIDEKIMMPLTHTLKNLNLVQETFSTTGNMADDASRKRIRLGLWAATFNSCLSRNLIPTSSLYI